MSGKLKNALKEEYNRIRRAMEKILNPAGKQAMPSLVLQPVKNRKLPGKN